MAAAGPKRSTRHRGAPRGGGDRTEHSRKGKRGPKVSNGPGRAHDPGSGGRGTTAVEPAASDHLALRTPPRAARDGHRDNRGTANRCAPASRAQGRPQRRELAPRTPSRTNHQALKQLGEKERAPSSRSLGTSPPPHPLSRLELKAGSQSGQREKA